MNPETRQTLIGVSGLTFVMLVALTEGFNGRVTLAYFTAVGSLFASNLKEKLPYIQIGGE